MSLEDSSVIRKVFGKGLLTPVAMWLLLWGASCLEDWSPGSWWDGCWDKEGVEYVKKAGRDVYGQRDNGPH